MRTKRFFSGLLAAFALVVLPPSSNAVPLVYEGFDYPVGQELAGQIGGLGFGGEWELNEQISGGTTTDGLKFSDYLVSGNAALLSAQANDTISGLKASNERVLNADFGPGPQTVWSSYLISYKVEPGTSPAFYSGMSTSKNDDWQSHRGRMMSNGGGANFGVSYEGGNEVVGGSNVASTTYLMIGKYVGGSGMTVWALSAANYDKLKASGITEEGLNSNNLWKQTDPYTDNDSGDTLLDYVGIGCATFGEGSSMSVTFDELKYGQSLSDVLSLPAQPAK